MITIQIPIIVEGKYDKAKLSGVVDATVITTDGFGIFKNEEKQALIRRLGQNGLILLCDSDGGGKTIRSHLRGYLGGIKVYDLYTPAIEGKEKRKPAPSKAGILGVEGVPNETLRSIFASFAAAHPELAYDSDSCPAEKTKSDRKKITVADLYALGLTGNPDSAALRDEICKKIGLPHGMGAKQFAEALSLIGVGTDELEG